MATRAWDTVPVFGWWRVRPGVPLAPGSKIRFTIAGTDRVRRVNGRMVYPGGITHEVEVGNQSEHDATIKARIHDAMRDAAELEPGFDSVAWEARWSDHLDSAIFTSFYAVDDPDITPNEWQVKVEERLTGGAGKIYYIEPRLAQIDPAGEVPGINLADIEVPPGSPTAPAPVYAKGQPGGIAALSLAGEVLDAFGTPITGGESINWPSGIAKLEAL